MQFVYWVRYHRFWVGALSLTLRTHSKLYAPTQTLRTLNGTVYKSYQISRRIKKPNPGKGALSFWGCVKLEGALSWCVKLVGALSWCVKFASPG